MTKKKILKKDEPKKHELDLQLLGWKCPVCGRGNSPWSSTCPCQPFYNVQPYWTGPIYPANPQYDPNLPYYKVTCSCAEGNP